MSSRLRDRRKHLRASPAPQESSPKIPLPCTDQKELFPLPLFWMKNEIIIRICCSKSTPRKPLRDHIHTRSISATQYLGKAALCTLILKTHRCKSSPQGRCGLCSCVRTLHTAGEPQIQGAGEVSSYSRLLRQISTRRETIPKTPGCNSTHRLCCCSGSNFLWHNQRVEVSCLCQGQTAAARTALPSPAASLSTTPRLHRAAPVFAEEKKKQTLIHSWII